MPAIRGSKSKKKTRRYTRDIDQIQADLKDPRHLEQYKETKAAEDLPGLGQWYCIECAKWFAEEANFKSHVKGKNHKRRCVSLFEFLDIGRELTVRLRVKQLKEEPHTQKTADAAVGLWTDNGQSKTDEMATEPS
jgi:bud site selection protein 20